MSAIHVSGFVSSSIVKEHTGTSSRFGVPWRGCD
jgi:hypothetical protein